MKKLFFASLIITTAAGAATSSTPWWRRDTVCKIDTSKCYATMGAGFETGMWDADSKCWGLKLICPAALTESTDVARPISKNNIAKNVGINSDYDTSVLNGDCFGARRTVSNGTTTMNGQTVNIWCTGVLSRPDETVANGEITYGAQPTCKTLADDGYAAVMVGKCWGKKYDTSKYFIECGDALVPTRLISLNGATDYNEKATKVMDKSTADKLFDTMYATSRAQHDKYFTTTSSSENMTNNNEIADERAGTATGRISTTPTIRR